MGAYVALLRGINVGPKKRIRMEPLRDLVSGLGFEDVRTLVNSGNVVFTGESDPATIAQQLDDALRDLHGLDVRVVVRTADEMADIVTANPFPEVAKTPKLLHVSFLATALPASAIAKLNALDIAPERMVIREREIYLHAPNGLSGASSAYQRSGRLIPVVSTSRNWNTVTRLAEMADS
jgi:uncharacterized protein (DUF1697 family)